MSPLVAEVSAALGVSQKNQVEHQEFPEKQSQDNLWDFVTPYFWCDNIQRA